MSDDIQFLKVYFAWVQPVKCFVVMRTWVRVPSIHVKRRKPSALLWTCNPCTGRQRQENVRDCWPGNQAQWTISRWEALCHWEPRGTKINNETKKTHTYTHTLTYVCGHNIVKYTHTIIACFSNYWFIKIVFIILTSAFSFLWLYMTDLSTCFSPLWNCWISAFMNTFNCYL